MMRVFVFNSVMVYLSALLVCNQTSVYRREYKGLKHVPSDISPKIIQIYLYHNDIVNITKNTFLNNSLCTKLSFDHNALVEVRASYWVGLSSLKLLFLQFNKIQYLHDSAFATLPKLEGLYLKANKLQTLSPNIFHLHPQPIRLHMTLHRNPLIYDFKLCWLQRRADNGWIKGISLDGLSSIQCSVSSTEYMKTGSNNSDELSSTKFAGATTEIDLSVFKSVESSQSQLVTDIQYLIFLLIAVVVVLVLVTVGRFCLSRFNTVTRKESDASMELQPCESTTTRDNRDFQEYVDPQSQPPAQFSSSRVYTYPYDHMIDRFAAFLHIHLRHRQQLYSIRNQRSNSRPSSVPLIQAPSPPGQTPPSCPLILPFPTIQDDHETLQCLSTGDEYLEPIPQINVTPLLQSSFYEEIMESDRTNQYAEIT